MICVSLPIARVVSFAPSLTEILFELGAGDLLAGRTARCNSPAEAGNAEIIGEYMRPDLERVMFLKPDLILTTKTGARKGIVVRFEKLGIPVFVSDSKDIVAIFDLIEKVGELLGRQDESKALSARLRSRQRALQEILVGLKKPTVLFVVGLKPLIVAGGKSFVGSLVREAGGKNIAEDSFLPYAKFSIEEVIKKDPDLIVVLNKECAGEKDCLEEWKRFSILKAVKNDRVYYLDADLLARPSPRIVEALEKLATILHPEASESVRSGRMIRAMGD